MTHPVHTHLTPQVKIITFGIKKRRKNQRPLADTHVDCQVLDNPPAQIYAFDGTSAQVQHNMMYQMNANKHLFKWFQNILDNAIEWCNWGLATGNVPVLSFYCFGGRHRSVATAEMVSRFLHNKGFVAQVEHLDLNKGKHHEYRFW